MDPMASSIEKLQNREKIFATTLVSIRWSGVIEIFKNYGESLLLGRCPVLSQNLS
jgi:hypothetical protein